MPVNTWAEIPTTNTLSSLDPATLGIIPPGANWVGTRGMTAGFFAWTGGVWDESTLTFRFPMPGGHNDYGGNNPYRVNIGANTPTFSSDRLPSGAIGMPAVDALGPTRYLGVYDDGRRRPGHSYNNHCYVPSIGAVVVTRTAGAFPDGVNSVGGLGATIAPHVRQAYTLDNAGEATLFCDYGAISGQGGGGTSSDDGAAAFDPTRGNLGTVWVVGCATSRLIGIDVETRVATARGASDNYFGSGGTMLYLPGLDVLAFVGPGTNFRIMRLDTGGTTLVTPSVSGSFSAGFEWDTFSGAAVSWDETAQRLLLWCNPTNRDQISTLTPSNPANPSAAWTRGTLTVSGSNTVTPPLMFSSGQTGSTPFGRGVYSQTLGGFLLVGNTTQKPHFFAMDPTLGATTRATSLSSSLGQLTFSGQAGVPSSVADDWAARSTAPGVTHAENWSSFATAAETYNSPRTGGMNKNPSSPTTFNNAFELITDAGHVLSGKAMRLWHGKNNYGNPGTIDNQYMSIPFNGNRNAVNGQYPTGAYLTKVYVQVCFWTDAFLDYYWKLGDGSLGGSKIFIIDNWNTTATTGEFVVTDSYNEGFVRAYRITTGGGSVGLDRTVSTPVNSNNFQRQNAIDRGGVLTDMASYLRRFGPFYQGMTGGTSQASPLSTQGRPDPNAAIGGVTFNRGGITVVEVELDLPNDRARIWAGPHGQAPTLIGDTALDSATGGLGLFGSRLNGGAGTGWSGIYLSNLIYTATGAQNPGYPTDAYTDYSEIIVSQEPINFPGGFVPPGTLPSWVGAVGTAVALPTSTLSTSGAPWTGGGGITDYQKVMGAWGGGCLNTKGIWRAGTYVPGTFLVIFGGGHGDYAGNELYAYGPIGSNTPTWSRIIDPTVPPAVDVARLGGYPVSRHTYDSLVYLPDQNRMLCIGAAGYHNAGNAFNTGDVFDFSVNPASANPWTTADSGFPAYNGGGAGTISIVTGYNKTTGKAWGLGNGNSQKLGSYTASTGTWASTDIDRPFGPGSGAADIWHTQNIMVFVSGQTAYGVNLALTTPTVVALTTSGSLPPSSGSWVANWDTTGNRFVFADSSTGLTLYYLTPPGSNFMAGTWVWSSETFTGTAPTNQSVNGMYGRVQMVDTIGGRGLLIVPSPSTPAIFYRMS
jgi:hypothetical protein